jgi:hypothetical protein
MKLNQTKASNNDDRTINTKNTKGKKSMSKKCKIDRDLEDAQIMEFQVTQDPQLFRTIYDRRIPTLRYLAKKHAYLHDSKEDMFCYLNRLFLTCVRGYIKTVTKVVNGKEVVRNTPFNTYFFSAVLNRNINLNAKNDAQKRIPKKNVLSLSYEYDGQSGEPTSLENVIYRTMPSPIPRPDEAVILKEIVEILSGGDLRVADILNHLGRGRSISSLVEDSKRKMGVVNIGRKAFSKLKDKKHCESDIEKIIKEDIDADSFSLLDFSFVDDCSVSYEVELPKTEESEFITDTIRRIRKESKGNVRRRLAIS